MCTCAAGGGLREMKLSIVYSLVCGCRFYCKIRACVVGFDYEKIDTYVFVFAYCFSA